MPSLPRAVSEAKKRISPARYFDWHRAVTNLKAEHLDAVAQAHHSSREKIKLVGLLMSDYSDKYGRKVHPGSARLQSHIGCKPEAIRRAIRALEEFGLVACVSPGRPGRTAEYILTLPQELSDELHSRWGTLLLERDRDREPHVTGPLPQEGCPPTGGAEALPGETSSPPIGVNVPLPQEGPPDQHQINDQTTHHRVRKRAGGASKDVVAEVATVARCTHAEATAMIEIAAADPTTTRSAIGRLLSDPVYGARMLRAVRDKAGEEAREERREIARLLTALPSTVAECVHGQHDGLAPNRNDKPMCPQCRRTPGVEALTLGDVMQLGSGAGAA